MYRRLALAIILIVAATACGFPPGPGTDTGADADANTDSTSPEFRDLKVSIMGEYSSTSNLVNGDAERIVPVPVTAEVTVFATDTETSGVNLEVELVDENRETLSLESKSFRNGLWTLSVGLSPGTTLRVRATDSAGNATVSEHSLTLLSREEALVSNWQRRFYTNEEEPQIKSRRSLEFDDGNWVRELETGKVGGTYRLEGDDLNLRQTYKTDGPDADSDRSTVEVETVSSFYVDDKFVSVQPWTRVEGSSSEVAGTWSRSSKIYERNGESRSLAVRIEETLELNKQSGMPNTWSYTEERMVADGNDTTSTASGTYERLELTTNYGNNYGTFLVRTTEARDGSTLNDPVTRTELYRRPLDKLLISPYVRDS